MPEVIGKGVIEVDGDTSGFDRAMDKAGGKASSAAKKTTKEVEKHWDDAIGAIEETAKAGLEEIGGDVAGLGSALIDVTKAFGAMGAVAGGLAAAGGGFALLAAGMQATVDQAREVRDEMLEAGEAAEIPPEALASLNAYDAAAEGLADTVDDLTLRLGAALAPTLTRTTTAFDVLLERGQDVRGLLEESGDQGKQYADQLGYLSDKATNALAPLLELGGALSGISAAFAVADRANAIVDSIAASKAAAESTLEYAEAMTLLGLAVTDEEADEQHRARLVRESQEAEKQRLKDLAEAQRAAREAEAAARKQAVEDAQAEKAALDDMLATAKQVSAQAKLDEERRDTEALNAWNRAWLDTEAALAGVNREMADLGPATDRAMDKMTDAVDEGLDKAKELEQSWKNVRDQVLGLAQDTLGQLTDMWVAGGEEQANAAANRVDEVQAEEERLNAELASLQEQRNAATNIGERQQLDREIANTKALIAIRQEQEQAAKDAALDAWKTNQEMQAASVGINAAAAFGLTLATTPGFPFNLIAAGVAAGAVLSAAIPIFTASPPEFPTGLSPDHHLVGVQHGEPILSRRANAELERQLGPDAADRLNRGQPLSGGGVTNVYLGRKLIGVAVAATATRPVDPRLGKGRRR